MATREISKTLGEELLEFRIRNDISQTELGRRLGLSQVQISRIEKGLVSLSDNVIARIQKILKRPLVTYSFTPSITEDNNWVYASFSYPSKMSGDRVYINLKSIPDKSCVAHFDAAGSDVVASINADYTTIALEAALSDNQPSIYPEALYYRLNKTFKGTKDFWRGEPSVNFIFSSYIDDKVAVLNCGMPNLLKYSASKSTTSPLQIKKHEPVGLLPIKEYASSYSFSLTKGDVLFSFSDGFIEIYNSGTTLSLDLLLTSFSKALRGDAEGVALKLLQTLADNLKGKSIGDDISFVIISKK